MAPARRAVLFSFVAIVLWAAAAHCAAAEPVVEILADGLDQPTALALRPRGEGERDVLFVAQASSIHQLVVAVGEASTLKLLHVRPDAESPSFTPETEQPTSKSMITSLHFANRRALLAAASRTDRLERSVALVTLPADIESRQATMRSTANEPAEAPSVKLPGGYVALASNARQTYAVLQLVEEGQPTTAVILRSRLASNMLGPLTPLETALQATDVSNPVTIAVSPDGYVAVLYQGEDDGSSQLVFAEPEPRPGAGKAIPLPLQLPQAVAIGYGLAAEGHPRLYALAADGLYRIDSKLNNQRRMEASATKLVSLTTPTAMAVGGAGVVYVLTLGGGDEKSDGKLLKITGDF